TCLWRTVPPDVYCFYSAQGLAKAKDVNTKMDPPAQASCVKAEGMKVKDSKEDETCTEKDEKIDNSTAKGEDLWERFKPPAGSWSCSICMVSNQASASRCQACEEPRPATSVGSTAAATPSSMPSPAPAAPLPLPPPSTAASNASRWECSECWVMNVPDAQRCAACEAPRASASGSAPSVTTSATAAAAAATTTTTTAAAGAATASLWECDTCLVRNLPNAVRCIACETPRACAGGGDAPSAAATAAAAAFSFTLSASSGSGGFGGVSLSTTDTAVKPFKFGIPTSGSTKPADAAASTESPVKPFSFGTTTEVASKTFKLGSSTEQSSKTFTFGSSTEAPAKTLKFGSATEESKALKFGSTTEEPSAKAFKFGTSEEPSAKAFKVGETAQEPTKMFTFGASSGEPAKGLKLSTTVEGPAKSSDVSSSTEQPAKALKFGCAAEEPAKSSQSGSTPGDVVFGSAGGGEHAKPFQPGLSTSAAEGAGSSVKLAPTASEPSKGFSFGPAAKEPAKPFTFGSAPPEPAFKFGSSTAEQAKPLKFGSSEEQQTHKHGAPPTTEPAKLFQFGAPASEAPKFGTPADAPTKPFSFGLPTTTVAAPAAPKPFMFGVTEKPAISATPAATEQLQASSQGANSGGQLPGLLSGAAPLAPAMPESSLAAAPQTVEPPKPAFPQASQFVFGQKSDSGAGTFSFGSQSAAPPNFASPLGATPLPSFGTLTAKPLEQQPQPVAQPTFGIGATATVAPAFGTLSAPKPAVTSAVAPTATSMPGGFGCQPTASTGFGLPAAAPPTQPSFVFRPPPATTTPVTFQFGSTGPTAGGVFRFGAQPSQPSTPLQQQPQQQQPAQEAFGTPFGQTAPMQFSLPQAAPPFGGMSETENPFSATGSSGGPMQQRRIRKAIRRKPTPR
ncbi:hypothetical protein V5799_010486, partial [Amblyomma americanum]